MKSLKNWILLLISIISIGTIVMNFKRIKEKIDNINKSPEKKIVIQDSNEYTKDYDFIYVKQVENYIPKSEQDILNIFYSILNQGWEEFTFYCPDEYESCLDDIEKISNNEVVLSDINNFVHPYNSYSSIRTTYDDQGMITVKVTHVYSKEEINKIDKDIDNLIKENTTEEQTQEEKIKSIHDYIINKTKYDTERINTGKSPYDSTRIQGILYDNHAICSGYADLTSVILSKLGIKNYRISSDNHVWNAVYINGRWLHLDLTWDDPVSTSGIDTLIDTYFLITDTDMKEIDTIQDENGNDKVKDEHNYNKKVYEELIIY